jgi:8-oxo-dGTP pyrophosphatase MutT (NUDIX family)
MAPRPTFVYKGNPVRAAGILLYTRVNGDNWYLLRKAKGKWQDTGGKTDVNDTNIIDTAVREATEETNGRLFCVDGTYESCSRRLKDLLTNGRGHRIRYNKRSKYVLFVLYVEGLKHLPLTRFGSCESDGMKHVYKWFEKLPKLHYRLRGMSLHSV